MKRLIVSFTVLCSVLMILGLSSSARADISLYQTPDYIIGNYPPVVQDITGSWAVSDPFMGGGNGYINDLTYADVRLYTEDGPNQPQTVDWRVGSTPFSADIGSGTANISGGIGPNYQYPATIPLSGAVTSDTTYWLTLMNGTTVLGTSDLQWIVTDPYHLTTYQSNNAPYLTTVIPCQADFLRVYGNQTQTHVPEPTTLLLVAAGLIVVEFRRKFRGVNV